MADPVSAETVPPLAAAELRRRYVFLLGLAVIVLAIDQTTKHLVASHLAGGPSKLLGGALWLEYSRNTGAAFSILPGRGSLFVAIAIAVSGGILLYFRRVAASPVPVRLGLALVLGGALGNLIDRLRLGYVVDFIDLRWWPVFNLADSAIVIGVALLVLSSLLPAGGGLR